MTHAVGIIATERNVYVALDVVSLYSYLLGVGLAGKALEVNCRRVALIMPTEGWTPIIII